MNTENITAATSPNGANSKAAKLMAFLHVFFALAVGLVHAVQREIASPAKSLMLIGHDYGFDIVFQILLVAWPYVLSWGLFSRRSHRSFSATIIFAVMLGGLTAAMFAIEFGLIWNKVSSLQLFIVTLVEALLISYVAAILFTRDTTATPQTVTIPSPEAQDEEEPEETEQGPPWTCTHCGAENPPTFYECWKCEKMRPESSGE